ncbi:MAG: tRNA nucleotidyltransferase, partial [Candidatus Kapabacteria bacterium]|nr:tRNA nucleotidyltransferase [Candidatus Kapabacteria bacterium]
MSTQRDPIRISITDPVLIRVAALAEERGVDAYVVGGYVRDAVMGRPRTDIDITVVGDAIEFARFVAESFHTTIIEYKQYRTAMVPVRDHHLEFVGTRSESYETDSRNPIVHEGTLQDDLR